MSNYIKVIAVPMLVDLEYTRSKELTKSMLCALITKIIYVRKILRNTK